MCEAKCTLCDGHHGCDNCYYGAIDSELPSHCEDCGSGLDNWVELGDTYCRKCGRKLSEKSHLKIINKGISEENIRRALQVLVDNGIEEDEADIVLQAIGYTLFDEELFPGL